MLNEWMKIALGKKRRIVLEEIWETLKPERKTGHYFRDLNT